MFLKKQTFTEFCFDENISFVLEAIKEDTPSIVLDQGHRATEGISNPILMCVRNLQCGYYSHHSAFTQYVFGICALRVA